MNAQKPRIFVSYKRKRSPDANRRSTAFQIHERLENDGYDVFIDAELPTGKRWAEKILENILQSDVLVAVLETDTYDSEWVRREIDMARGAQVSILPLIAFSQSNEDVLANTLARLALGELQVMFWDGMKWDELKQDIDRLAGTTDEARRKRWQAEKIEQPELPPAVFDESVENTGKKYSCCIHLGTGDITQLTNVDVLVNTENTYMQMARIFEPDTVSSCIRRKGSYFLAHGLADDFVQGALDEYIAANASRPILPTYVIPTLAGHPESELVENGIRYIFHAATVSVKHRGPAHRRIEAIAAYDEIYDTIDECFDTVYTVDIKQGMFAPENTQSYEIQQEHASSYEPIKSIAFPIFGTGIGGKTVNDILPKMLKALRQCVEKHQDNDGFHLEDIFIFVFLQKDVTTAIDHLREIFGLS